MFNLRYKYSGKQRYFCPVKVSAVPLCAGKGGKTLFGHRSLAGLARLLVALKDSCQRYTQISHTQIESVLNYTKL